MSLINLAGTQRIVVCALLVTLCRQSSLYAFNDSESPAATRPSEAKDLLEENLAVYRRMQSYQDRLTCTFHSVAKYDDGEDASRQVVQRFSLAYRAPNRIRFESESFRIQCDGTTLWVYLPKSRHYVECAAPATLSVDLLPENNYFEHAFTSHPLFHVFVKPRDHQGQWLLGAEKWEDTHLDPRGPLNGRQFSGKAAVPRLDNLWNPVHAWFNKRGYLIEFVSDSTEVTRRLQAEFAGSATTDSPVDKKTIEKQEIRSKIDSIRVDEPIPADLFVFTPGIEDKRVDSFDQIEQKKPEDLKGKAAPAVSATDLEGVFVNLEKLRGNVVVLDFWATWCEPCVKAIPHMSKLSDELASKKVIFIGINRDGPGNEPVVKRFLKKRNIRFSQILDNDGAIADQFRVSGIPCVVVIDAQGVIRDVRAGFGSEDDAKLISKRIERLLAERSTTSRRSTSENDDIDDEAWVGPWGSDEDEDEAEVRAMKRRTPELLQDFMEVRLIKKKSFPALFSSWNAKRIDVDGDGANEIVAIDFDGALRILNGDGSGSRSIRLKEVSSYRTGDVDTVKFGGETYWLYGSIQGGMSGEDETGAFGLFKSDGSPVWVKRLELAKNRTCSFKVAGGDLDQDGTPEIVVATTVWKFRRKGNTTYQEPISGFFAVYDWKGNRLTQRSAGRSVELISVTRPREENQSREVLVISDGEAQCYSLQLLKDSPQK